MIGRNDFHIRALPRMVLSENGFRIALQSKLAGQDFALIGNHNTSRDQRRNLVAVNRLLPADDS